MKNKKWKKKQGFSELVGTSLCILVLLIILISSVHFIRILEFKRVMNDYGREYLLRLETAGTLTSSEVTELTNRIHRFSSDGSFQRITIVYNGDNKPVSYGNEVSLSITVISTWKEMGLSKVYDYIQDNYTFQTTLYSTSKA